MGYLIIENSLCSLSCAGSWSRSAVFFFGGVQGVNAFRGQEEGGWGARKSLKENREMKGVNVLGRGGRICSGGQGEKIGHVDGKGGKVRGKNKEMGGGGGRK